MVAEQFGVRRYRSVAVEEKEFSKTGRENMKLRTITVESRHRDLAFISKLSWISWSEKHRETNSETNRKTWRAMSTVYFLFFILCTRSLAAEPKTIAFLEEHNVAAGTPQTVGALYVVPPGRKAYVSNMVCEIRSFNDPGYSFMFLVVFANATITGPGTSTAGMNPLACLNSDYITTKTSSPGFTLLPGNYIYALYGNFGNNLDFQMLSAFIFEDDL